MPRDLFADEEITKQPRDLFADEPQGKSIGEFASNAISDAVRPENLVAGVSMAVPQVGQAMGLKSALDLGRESIANPIEGLMSKLGVPSKYQSPADIAQNMTSKITGQQYGEPVRTSSTEMGEGVRQSLKPEELYKRPVTGGLNALGLIMGAKSIARPVNMTKPASTEKANTLMLKASDDYRTMLRPKQGEIKKIEVRGGKDLDSFYKLAAEEKLPIKSSGNKELKLDTDEARTVLDSKQNKIHETLNTLLENSDTKFNLKDIANKAKVELKSRFKNAEEYETAVKDVDNFIEAEIRRYGETVSAKDLNSIKQGMWTVGYKALAPTADKTSRILGHIANETIEQTIKDPTIRALNKKSGDYATLNGLLENAHGRVVQGGKLGKYVGNVVGGAAGAAVGSMIPVPGLGTATGTLIGAGLGGKAASMLSRPERMTKGAISKVNKAENIMSRKPEIPTGANRLISAIAGKLSIGSVINTPYGKFKKKEDGSLEPF